MKRVEFSRLFHEQLDRAIELAEKRIGRRLSSNVAIELHDAGSPGLRLSSEDVFSRIFREDGLYYPIIDVGVKSVDRRETILFMRVSDLPPSNYDNT